MAMRKRECNLKSCGSRSFKMSAKFLPFFLSRPEMTKEAKKLVESYFLFFKGPEQRGRRRQRKKRLRRREKGNDNEVSARGRLKMVTMGVICVCLCMSICVFTSV